MTQIVIWRISWNRDQGSARAVPRYPWVPGVPGYRPVPIEILKIWVPLGTGKIWELGYRWVTGTEQILEIGYRWVPGTEEISEVGYRWVTGTEQISEDAEIWNRKNWIWLRLVNLYSFKIIKPLNYLKP